MRNKKSKIVLVGAGGKMGLRLTNNLLDSRYDVSYLEINRTGIQKLNELTVDVSNPDEVLPGADIVIYAVPDVHIGKVTEQYVPMMKKGAMGMFLDPAAPLAGHLPRRDDISYFVSHPSHPSVFNWEMSEEAHYDYFGGIAAKQSIVCTLIQGTFKEYQQGEELAKIIYAPVTKSYQITLEQMGMLEPALSETFAGSIITVLKEGVDEIVDRGVPKEAAYEFFLGHINIELALLFGQLPGGQFSDAAKKAIEIGKKQIFKDDWKKVFDKDNVLKQIEAIT